MRKLSRKWFFFGVVLLAFFAVIVFRSHGQTQTQEFIKVRRGDIATTVSGAGTISGKTSANLRFKTGGKLVYLGVKPGDKVLKGQLVASLDSRMQSIAFQQALNTLRDKEAALENIHDQLKDNDSDETFAQKALRTSAEVAKDNAFDSVRAARVALEEAQIFSPISGIVTGQDEIVVGQNISPTDLIAQVNNISQTIFIAEIDEADIEKIKVGQTGKVMLNASGDKELEAKVIQVIPSVKTITSGATVINVKLLLNDNKIPQIFGLNGKVDITISEKKNVLEVPLEVLTENDEVYIKKGDNLEKIKVQTGVKSETEIEVSGVQESTEVLLNPTTTLALQQRSRGIFSLLRLRK